MRHGDIINFKLIKKFLKKNITTVEQGKECAFTVGMCQNRQQRLLYSFLLSQIQGIRPFYRPTTVDKPKKPEPNSQYIYSVCAVLKKKKKKYLNEMHHKTQRRWTDFVF